MNLEMEVNVANLKVGTQGCPVKTIASILHQNPTLQENWPNFAKGFGTPPSRIENFRQDLHLQKITYYDIICNVVELWVGREGSRATLNVLFHVLEDIGIGGNAEESIRLQLNLPCKGAGHSGSLLWADLSPAFQKRVGDNFKQLLPFMTLDEAIPLLKGDLLVNLMTGKELSIFRETIPDSLCYYVDRKIISRSYISTAICQQYSLDTFLFIGIDRYQLTRLTGGQPVRGSSDQLKGVTVKFMILDHPNHYERICKRIDNPVHLLHYENERLLWIRSRGEMKTLQEYVDKCQREQNENDFCLKLKSNCNLPIFISDTPGMGKSVLLAQIGRRLRELCPDRTVIFLVLSEFIQQYKLIPKQGMVATIEEILINMVCLNELGRAVLRGKLSAREGITIELLFDGFDEVNSKEERLAYAILQTIKASFRTTRLLVTSRPQYLEKLENNLGTLGYNIEPFDEMDQLWFLTSFWTRDGQNNEMRFEEFARQTLGMVKSNMNLTEQDIAGIPLQCLLIGEVYEDEAMASTNNLEQSTLLSITHINSIADLYKFTIARKFDKYLRLYMSRDFSGTDVLMNKHVVLSLQLIFPDFPQILKGKLQTTTDHFDTLLKIGILESWSTRPGSTRFIHRTFAEYFVAWFVVDRLKGKSGWCVDLQEFFVKVMMICIKADTLYWGFANPVITFFLNSLLANDLPSILIPPTNKLDEDVTIVEEMAMQVAHACAYHDFVNIFKLCEGVKLFGRHAHSIFNDEFLILTIDKSFVELVRLSLERFEVHHEFDIGIKTQALRRAVQRGEFSVLEFLLKEKGLRELVEEPTDMTTGLIVICLVGTHEATTKEIIRRTEVIRMLVGINPTLLEANYGDDDIRTPLLSPATHVKLLIALIQLGANVLVKDDEDLTVLHIMGQEFTSADYHSLVSIIPMDKLQQLVHIKLPLTGIMYCLDPLPETLDIFQAAGADFSELYEDGFSVLANAVRWGRNTATLTKLVQHGAETGWKGLAHGEGLLHIAAESGNFDAVLFCVTELRINVNVLDCRGRNPLDYAIHSDSDKGRRLECGMFLHDRGCLFRDALNSEDQSLLHKAALNGSVPSVVLLLHFGVDVNASDRDGNTPLHLGLTWKSGKDYAVVKLLLDKGANPNAVNKLGETPFCQALSHQSLGVGLFQLLKNKTEMREIKRWATHTLKWVLNVANRLDEQELASLYQECVDDGADTNFTDEGGNSLLHYVAKTHLYEAICFLVEEKGMDVNSVNYMNQTALHIMSLQGYRAIPEPYLDILKFLLKHGADVRAKDGNNMTCLHYLVSDQLWSSHFHAIVQYLLDNQHTSLFEIIGGMNGATALQLAVQNFEPEERTLSLLHSEGVNFNQEDRKGDTLLSYAVLGKRRVKFLSSLINQFGVNWTFVNMNGRNMLHLSAQFGTIDSLKFFLELGELNVNQVDMEGSTPLHFILLRDEKQTMVEGCRLLIDAGADISMVDKRGRSPLQIVMEMSTNEYKDDLMQMLK